MLDLFLQYKIQDVYCYNDSVIVIINMTRHVFNRGAKLTKLATTLTRRYSVGSVGYMNGKKLLLFL